MLEANEHLDDLIEEERKAFDPLKLHKLDESIEIDLSSLDDEELTKLVNTKTGKPGRPKKPIAPFDEVVQNEDGSFSVVKRKGKPRREKTALKSGRVSEDTLRHIAETYYRNPDWKTVALLTGHTADFLITFSSTFRFHELLTEIRRELDKKEEAAETNIVEQALEELQDRIVNGDEILDSKTGSVVKVKMKGKELASVLKTVHNVRQTTRGEANSRSESVNPHDKLSKLAEQFARFAGAKDITPPTEDN